MHFPEYFIPSPNGWEAAQGTSQPLIPRRWWDTPAPCTGRWCWEGRAWTPGQVPVPPPAGSSGTSRPPGSQCCLHGGCSQLTVLYRQKKPHSSQGMFLWDQHENQRSASEEEEQKPHTLWPGPTTSHLKFEKHGQQVCGYLVNILRKVCMICSVKGTPICTLRPRNKVRKKLSISSVTSKQRDKANDHRHAHRDKRKPWLDRLPRAICTIISL